MKLKIYFLAFLLFSVGQSLLAQNDFDSSKIVTDSESQKSDTTKEFHEVTKMAQFPGGQANMYAFISKNVKYPSLAFENDIDGRVIVQFVVRKDGTISDVETLGKKIGWGLEEEAMRVIKAMPNWEPAEMKGKNVAVRFRLPINFEISDDQKKKKPKKKKKFKSKPEAYD